MKKNDDETKWSVGNYINSHLPNGMASLTDEEVKKIDFYAQLGLDYFRYAPKSDSVTYIEEDGDEFEITDTTHLLEIVAFKARAYGKSAEWENVFDKKADQIERTRDNLTLFSDLADVLESGEVITRTNPALDGDVRVKRGGMNEGLVHLIDHRMRERVLNKNALMDEEQAKMETSAVLFLAVDNIDKAPAVKEDNGHFAVYNKGIKTVIGKDKNGRYVVTGYDNNQTKEEATESINAVIAQYGNTPEFLGIYAQVGAVVASYNILPQSQEKSITVNGKPRELKNGLKEGFVNAVKLVDRLMDANRELADENERLRGQLSAQKLKSVSR